MSGIINDIAIRSSRHHPEFKAGTKMVFNQTSAPTGWTKVTGSGNDTALRVTTGTVGTGGSVAFETAFASQTVSVHTLTTSEIPAHTHTVLHYEQDGGGAEWTWAGPNASAPHTTTTSSTGSGGSHGHGSINLDVSYVDVIIATKD
jgi:hypothetical protein